MLRFLTPASAALLAAALSSCGRSSGPAAPSGGVGSTPPPTTTSSSTTTSTSTTTTSAPAQRIVRQATFRDANGYQTAGTARVVQSGSDFTLELLADFRTSQSPALDVRLCVEPNCRSGPMLNLGELRSFGGRQSYDLPDDAGRYTHVVIYCRAVRLAFGFGVLG